MFKFATNKLSKKPNEENDLRRKLQKDLFAFSKVSCFSSNKMIRTILMPHFIIRSLIKAFHQNHPQLIMIVN